MLNRMHKQVRMIAEQFAIRGRVGGDVEEMIDVVTEFDGKVGAKRC